MKHQCPDEARRFARAEIREKARNSFYDFYRLMAPSVVPEGAFVEARHFRVLARALERVVTGETRRLLVAIPPRHGKSRLASVALPAWILGRDPSARIVCASYGQDLANDFARRSRELIRFDDYKAVFPETLLEPGGAALEELRTTKSGYRLATSVSGILTGKGADYALIDDPMKAADAQSEPARNAVYDWVASTLMSRFDKPGQSRIVVIMQRLHQDDLIGRLRDDGGWTVLAMPSEATERQEFDLGNGKTWVFLPGDLLFPDRFDQAALEQMRSELGESGYNAQILQRPVPPGGALFKLKHFQRYEEQPPYYEKIVQSWDTAMVDNETAAYTVCTTWKIWRYKLYLVDVFRKRLDFLQVEKAMLALREKYKANFVLLEISGPARSIANSLLKHHGGRSWLVWTDPKDGKVERATAQTPRLERKRVYLPMKAPWLETFESEVAQFPHGKYADQVDSMVHFLRAFDNRNRITRDLRAFEKWPEVKF